jgi:hypothetical protein
MNRETGMTGIKQQPTGIPGVTLRSQEWETIRQSGTVLVNSHKKGRGASSGDDSTPKRIWLAGVAGCHATSYY